MKRGGLINSVLLGEIGLLGHGDVFVVADAGLPIPRDVVRVDLAIKPGLPSLLDVVDAILSEGVVVERVVLAEEIRSKSPGIHAKILSLLESKGIDLGVVVYVPHEEFKKNYVNKAKFVVRTGEYTPYSNVAFVSGVPF